MSQTKQEIQSLLEEAGSSPRHRFGQNFMIDRNLVAIIARAGQIQRTDLVIEVGPGTGTLTEELLALADEVLAVEIDRDLAAMLQNRFADQAGFSLIQGDALDGKHAVNPELRRRIDVARVAGREVKLVANLPYNIASPLIIDLLLAGVSSLAFTVQKEVARRLSAVAGTEDYGPLTVMAQLLAKVELQRTLPPQAFWPQPKIESALVCMQAQNALGGDARQVGEFVQRLFSARRKTLRRALSITGCETAETILGQLGIDPQARPETLPPGMLLRLYRGLFPSGISS
jgi:16S rRNA (adenine1518-N6/adenine1519-N6)-dimethyltransferase